MNSVAIALIAFACAFGGGLLGMTLRAVVPQSHLDEDSKEIIKLGTGLIGTMAALVLGLLVASATASFDSEQTGFQQLATNLILLDRALEHYGPEAKHPRELLKRSVVSIRDRLSPAVNLQLSRFKARATTAAGGVLFDAIRDLSPQSNSQKLIQSQALQICVELGRTRSYLSQGEDSSVPAPFLVVLIFWLAVLFLGLGLLAPRNATVVVVLFVCAASVAAAVLLILDLDQPFEGLIRVSSDPLQDVLSQIGQ
jgi:hypothetical protein